MEVIFEFIRVGNLVKVNAIDVVTGIEISIMAPRGMKPEYLKEKAKTKLIWRLNRIPWKKRRKNTDLLV